MAKYSVDRALVIWNDTTGERFEISAGTTDDLSLVHLRFVSDDGVKSDYPMVFDDEMALLVGRALIEYVETKQKNAKKEDGK